MKIKNTFFLFLLLGLFLSSWYMVNIDVGGRTLITVSQLLLIIILLSSLLLTEFSLNVPVKIRRTIGLFFIGGFIFFCLSILWGLDIGPTIGAYRRLFLFPVIGIIAGATFSKLEQSGVILSRTLYTMFGLLIIIALINLVFKFYPLHDYALITRTSGIILSLLLFGHFYKELSQDGGRSNKLYILILVILIFFTASRGLYIAVAGGMLLLYFYKFDLSSTIRTIGLGTIAVCLFLFIYKVPYYNKIIDEHAQEFVDVYEGNYGSSGEDINNVGVRYFRYMSAYKIGLENPIFGHGLGYIPVGFYIGERYDRLETAKTAHNFLLTFWIKLGSVGIIFIMIFIFKIHQSISNIPLKIFFLTCYAYSLVDVMMVSNDAAYISVYFLVGFGICKQRL